MERYFRPMSQAEPRSPLKALITPESCIVQDERHDDNEVLLTIPEFLRDSPSAPIDFVRKHLAFFVSMLTDDWDLVHGAGLVKDQIGILLLGRARSGKSTICRHLQDYQIMEDDSLLLHLGSMHLISKGGMVEDSRNNELGNRKSMIVQESFIEPIPIKTFFFLSKRLQGGISYRIRQPHISRWLSLPDFIALPSMLSSYLRKPQIEVHSPGYVIGTLGDLSATLQTIRTLAGAIA